MSEYVLNKTDHVSLECVKVPKHFCPCCNKQGLSIFYAVENIPVHSCLLMSSREEAIEYPKGELRLGFCHGCGFISNIVFDSRMHEYSNRYEETQGFSTCFNTFAKSLAQRLIDGCDLHNKNILEIGCGKGEFLVLLCQLGSNRGIGIDPAYIPERTDPDIDCQVEFIKDFYSEKYSNLGVDFICCRHTLEHIGPAGAFLQMLRKAIGDRTDTIVFFEVPDTLRILREGAFWDVYYEHCSYFSVGSLARLFAGSGFEIIQLELAYADQYILLMARPAERPVQLSLKMEDDLAELTEAVDNFARICSAKIKRWHKCIEELVRQNRRVVLWGSGSKGVAFLTTLRLNSHIEYVVDINPYKHGKYMPGTGEQIVSPQFLTDYKPDYVIVMNPIYWREIQEELKRLRVRAELLPV